MSFLLLHYILIWLCLDYYDTFTCYFHRGNIETQRLKNYSVLSALYSTLLKAVESDARYASYRASLSASSDAFIVGAFIEYIHPLHAEFGGSLVSFANTRRSLNAAENRKSRERSTSRRVRCTYVQSRSLIRSLFHACLRE